MIVILLSPANSTLLASSEFHSVMSFTPELPIFKLLSVQFRNFAYPFSIVALEMVELTICTPRIPSTISEAAWLLGNNIPAPLFPTEIVVLITVVFAGSPSPAPIFTNPTLWLIFTLLRAHVLISKSPTFPKSHPLTMIA